MSTPTSSLPLRLGSDTEFAALRTALESMGYTEAAACKRLKLERISQFRPEGAGHLQEEPEDAIGLLIWLLMECRPISDAGAAKLPMAELRNLGLVDQSYSTAMLYPARGLYITSDRVRPVEGDPGKLSDDFVYSGIVANTDLFLDLVPLEPCEAFLDLCAGSGIAALAAARNGARHAWALDLTARSTLCAEFNRRLNSIENATAAEGDLYDPVQGLTFDRIVAHPPYLPVYRPQFIFDSGGADGEQVVKRIIEGLPRHLRPGGRFFALTMGTDRAEPFEHRLRGWLGEAEAEFDIAFVTRRTLTPHEYTASASVSKDGTPVDVRAWREVFAKLGVQTLAYGFLMIQRRERVRPVFTVRRQTSSRSGPPEHAWLLRWETAIVNGSAEQVLESRPHAAAGTKLRVEQQLVNGAWVPDGYQFEVAYPFSMEMQGQAWIAYLLAAADGSRTAGELLEALKADGALHPDTPPMEYARMLTLLVSGGFLEIV